MKKKLNLLVIISIIIFISVVLFVIFGQDKNKYLIEVTYAEYKEKVNNKENFILFIKQDGCKHCESFTPKFESVVNSHKVTAYYINLSKLTTEDRASFSSEVHVSGTPIVVFFENGKELDTYSRINGNKDRDLIIRKLKARNYIQ